MAGTLSHRFYKNHKLRKLGPGFLLPVLVVLAMASMSRLLAQTPGMLPADQKPPQSQPQLPRSFAPTPTPPTSVPAPAPTPAVPNVEPPTPPPASQGEGPPLKPPEAPPTINLNPPSQQQAVPGPRRFQFPIEPNTPLKDLLPHPPKVKNNAGPISGDDLSQVPEVEFQGAPAKTPEGEEAVKAIAFMNARINHLNSNKTDGFVDALRSQRLDLAGLPFAMGDACRTKGERSKQFTIAVATVRRAMQGQIAIQPSPTLPTGPGQPQVTFSGAISEIDSSLRAEGFWEKYKAVCDQEDKFVPTIDRSCRENITVARIAALMQILAPERPDMRLGLVKYLAGISHIEATHALARLAIFSAEDEVRQSAIESLKVRRERDYTEILVKGLRYPLPVVARRAAEAIVKLERTDLLSQLVAVLEEPDPRAPVVTAVNDKKMMVVHELVRVNHHRNCLLCHSPGNTATVSPEALTAEVPVPGQPLPSPSEGYRTSLPDLLVRVDVTYLRQDFSMLQPVADANPWPEMQRFDFLVRTRELSEKEAAAYQASLEKPDSDKPSPYQRFALAALRELTGRDAEPTAQAWRRLLEIPSKKG